jgi:hypothetical protein
MTYIVLYYIHQFAFGLDAGLLITCESDLAVDASDGAFVKNVRRIAVTWVGNLRTEKSLAFRDAMMNAIKS